MSCSEFPGTQSSAKLSIVVNDPSGVIQLFEEVNRRLGEAVTSCKSAWINEEARKAFHARVHATINTLFATVFNDLRYLESDLGVAIFNPEDRFPTLQEMAETIPELFASPSHNQVETVASAERMLRWVWFQWMQVQANLSSLLDTVEAVAAAKAKFLGRAPMAGKGPDFEEPFLIIGNVHRLKELTYEYLVARSELLRAHGKPAFGMSVSRDRSANDFILLTWKAYHRGEPSASYLLLLAIRTSLLDFLELRELDPKYQLITLATNHLVALAIKSGIVLPFGNEVIANILVNLENVSARCEPVRESLLLPLVRIGEEFVGGLGKISLTKEQKDSIDTALGLRDRG